MLRPPDDYDPDAALEAAVARQILLGIRESLTIAAKLRQRPKAVLAAIERLRLRCGGCIRLTRPFQDQERYVIEIVRRAGVEEAAARRA